MTWYLRALRFVPLMTGVVALGVLAGALRGAQAPVPSLTHGSLVPVPVVAVMAVLPPLLVLSAWLAVPPAALAVSVRSPTWGPLAMVGVCLSYALASGVLGHAGAVLENGRNALGILGLALLGTRAWGGRGGVLLPVAYLLASFLVGRAAGSSQPHAWAWVLRDGGDAVAFGLGLASTLLGLAAAWSIPRATVLKGEA